MACNEYERCQHDFQALHAKLDKLDEAIRGNGKPGIQTRLDRLETTEAKRSRLMWLILGTCVTLVVGWLWQLVR